MNRLLPLALAALLAAPALADKNIVVVNGTPIRQSEVLDRLWKRYGNDTVDEMIDELLLRQAAARSRIEVSAAEVNRRFARIRSQFSDPKVFAAQLAGAGTTVEALKAELRAQLVREKLIASAEGLSIGDQEIRQAFARDKDELGRPEAVHLRHILVDTKAQAQAVVSAVKGGADFRALARERSKAPTGKLNGGDYGFVARGMLPPDIEAIAFSMKPGELRVVPTEKGYHVLQVLARRAAAPAVYAKVKDELGEMLLQRKIKAVLPAYLRELRAKAEIKTPGD